MIFQALLRMPFDSNRRSLSLTKRAFPVLSRQLLEKRGVQSTSTTAMKWVL